VWWRMVIQILFLVAWCDVKLDNGFCSLLDYEKGYNSCFLRILKVINAWCSQNRTTDGSKQSKMLDFVVL
jgi:hypothetical protein